MRSTFRIRLSVSDEARRAYATRTGHLPGSIDVYNVNLLDLTADERAALIAVTGATPSGMSDYDYNLAALLTSGSTPVTFEADRVPETGADWAAIAGAYAAARDDAQRQQERAKEEEERQIRERLADFDRQLDELEALSDEALAERQRKTVHYLIDLPRGRTDEQMRRRDALIARAGSPARRAAEALAEAERAEAKRRDAERAAWVAEHGSDYLKRAVGAGYDCQRRYVEERAALEMPGFLVDFDEQADWRSRACPSEAALDRALALRDDGHIVEVVWLTRPVEIDDEDAAYGEPFDPREAIVVTGYLGRYTLVD